MVDLHSTILLFPQTGTVKVETHHITRLLEEHTPSILQNINIPSLKPFLIQCHCVGLLQEECLTKGSRQDNNLELMKIICVRGVEAFEGFLAALDRSVENDPGEKGHDELSKTLRTAYGQMKRRLSRSTSKAPSSLSDSLSSPLQMTSLDSHTHLEGIRVSVPEEDPMPERDGIQQPLRITNGPRIYLNTQLILCLSHLSFQWYIIIKFMCSSIESDRQKKLCLTAVAWCMGNRSKDPKVDCQPHSIHLI